MAEACACLDEPLAPCYRWENDEDPEDMRVCVCYASANAMVPS